VSREQHPSLSSVVFDTAGYEDSGVHDGAHVWHTAQGDGVGLFFFSIQPDLPSKARSTDELRQFFSSMLGQSGGKLVELHVCNVDGYPSVATIIKVPQQPSGMTYVGSIMIPFRDFSFVVKVQCEERGMTGLREAMILNGMLAKDNVASDNSGLPIGFSPDDAKFDAKFPEHPLSRLRKTLREIGSSLHLNDAVRHLPTFGLPEDTRWEYW
jgi:hypothetical protein